MKTISANNYKNIENVKYVEYTNIKEKNESVAQFFSDLYIGNNKKEELNITITSNIIGYIIDEENNEHKGYIEEHYVDSGSTDYYYTALIQ